MINDLKRGIRLLKYTYGIKMTVVLSALFLILALVIHFFSGFLNGSLAISSYFLLLVVGMMPVQLIYSLDASTMLLSSPKRKALQTSIPTMIGGVGYFIMYLVVMFMNLYQYWSGTLSAAEFKTQMVFVIGCTFGIVIYTAFAYKLFLISIFVFVTAYVVAMQSYSFGWMTIRIPDSIGIAGICLIGMAAVIASCVVHYLLTCLLYKVPVSKYAQMAPLRKYL